MKTRHKMLSDENAHMLFDHIIDGHTATYHGIKQAKESQLINENEFTTLMEKNTQRLIDRIKEFKLMLRMVCVAFAMLFMAIQVSGDELEIRRPTRTRNTHARARRGRRNEDLTEEGTQQNFLTL
jgi:hypothetical protein